MSALPPKADIRERVLDVRFGPKANSCTAAKSLSFDHLVGEHEEIVWHFETERPGGGKIDGEVEFGRLLDGDIAGLGALPLPYGLALSL